MDRVKGVIYALCVLANIFVAAEGYSRGGTEGYFQLFAAGSAVYFLVSMELGKDKRSTK